MIFLYPCSFCSLKLFHACTHIFIWILDLPMSNYGLFLWCYFVYAYAPYQGRFQGGRRGLAAPPWASLAPPWVRFSAPLSASQGKSRNPLREILKPPPPICSPAPRVYFGTYCVCQNERTVAVHLMCTQYRMENDTTITKAPCFPATLEHAACSRTHER